MRTLILTAAFSFTFSGTAFASETFTNPDIATGLSAISSEAQGELLDCLADESSSRAVRACTKAIRASAPNDNVRAHLYARRALHRMALGRFDEASNDFTRAGDLKSDASLTSMGQGFAAMMDNDLVTAQAKFEDCSGTSGVAPLAAYGLGLTHQMAGNEGEAREAYQQALALKPGWTAVSQQVETLD